MSKQLERQHTDLTMVKSESDTSLSSFESCNSSKRSVRFANVSVRKYNRVVGDHPETKVGPPLSIGWDYEQQDSAPLDEYEEKRSKKGIYRLSALQRKRMLNQEFGIPEKEIAASEKEVQKILKQRRQSNNQSKQSAKVESFVKSATRKMKRTFSRERLLEGVGKGMMFPVMAQ